MAELGAGLGSGYPAAIDTKQTFTNTGSPLSDGPTRMDAEVLNDALGALVAIEAELGIAPSGVWPTLIARLDAFIVGSVVVPQLIVAGVGPHAIGGAVLSNTVLRLTGALAGAAFGIDTDSLSLTPGATSDAAAIAVEGVTITKAGSGTHAYFASLDLRPFTVGAGAAALTDGATLRISAAPTGATNNYALWVAAGNSRFGGPTLGYDGNPTQPSYGFSSTTDLGMYRIDASTIGWTSGSTERMRLSGGILALGTTIVAGAAAGDLVLANNKSIRWEVVAGGSLLEVMKLDTGNALVFAPGGSTQVSFRDEILFNSGFQQFLGEIADPAAPVANNARLYIRDNGAGKTQLVVIFNTGAVQVIATQP